MSSSFLSSFKRLLISFSFISGKRFCKSSRFAFLCCSKYFRIYSFLRSLFSHTSFVYSAFFPVYWKYLFERRYLVPRPCQTCSMSHISRRVFLYSGFSIVPCCLICSSSMMDSNGRISFLSFSTRSINWTKSASWSTTGIESATRYGSAVIVGFHFPELIHSRKISSSHCPDFSIRSSITQDSARSRLRACLRYRIFSTVTPPASHPGLSIIIFSGEKRI